MFTLKGFFSFFFFFPRLTNLRCAIKLDHTQDGLDIMDVENQKTFFLVNLPWPRWQTYCSAQYRCSITGSCCVRVIACAVSLAQHWFKVWGDLRSCRGWPRTEENSHVLHLVKGTSAVWWKPTDTLWLREMSLKTTIDRADTDERLRGEG